MDSARTIKLRIKDRELCSSLLSDVLHPSVHMKNMLIILYNGVDIDLKPYFLKADVLRALLYDRVGGKKAHLVKKMSEFIGNLPSDQKEIYQSLYEQAQNFDAKHCYKLIKVFIGEMKGFFTKKKRGENARPPRAKKLRDISNAALPLDKERVKLEDHGFRIRIGPDKIITIPFPRHVLDTLCDFKRIVSYRLSTDGRNLSLDVSYDKNTPANSNMSPLKLAGMDPGVNNLASILILDESSPSLVISGSKLTSYNQLFNKKLAKLSSRRKLAANERADIEREVWESLDYSCRPDEDAEIIELVHDWKQYNEIANSCKKEIDRLFANRKDFLDTNLKKIAKALLKDLRATSVTSLVTSRNILTAKQGSKMGKINNQKFVNIPFAKLIDTLKLYGPEFGIEVVDDIDESYTSKTNCLHGDVIKAQKLCNLEKKSSESKALRATVFQGRRRKGEFLSKTGHVYHSDLNGALNIITLFLGDQSHLEPMKSRLFKLCNPRVLRGDEIYAWVDQGKKAAKTSAV